MFGAALGGAMAIGQDISNSALAWKNWETSRDSLDWQKHFSKTRYQRAVTDMRAAGLNPILAATKGFAQGGTGGASGAGSMAPHHSSAAMLQRATAKKLQQDVAESRNREWLQNAQRVNTAENTQLVRAQERQVDAVIKEIEARTKNLGASHSGFQVRDEVMSLVRDMLVTVKGEGSSSGKKFDEQIKEGRKSLEQLIKRFDYSQEDIGKATRQWKNDPVVRKLRQLYNLWKGK